MEMGWEYLQRPVLTLPLFRELAALRGFDGSSMVSLSLTLASLAWKLTSIKSPAHFGGRPLFLFGSGSEGPLGTGSRGSGSCSVSLLPCSCAANGLFDLRYCSLPLAVNTEGESV